MIYHIITKTDWAKALEQNSYEAASLTTEGFMHASDEHQVDAVLQRFYKEQGDLILLHIDETKLTSALRYEKATDIDDSFPHLFGPLNLDAVVKITDIASA